MKTVIHLKTARVYGQNTDMTPKVERTTVKLENGDNFNKFVRLMHLKGYMESEPPYVGLVLQKDKSDKYQEIDKTPWQKQVDEALKSKGIEKPIDYKAEFKKQKAEAEKQKAQNVDMMKRLEALESNGKSSKRKSLEAKAKELKISFRANIGDVKLLEKIQSIEPDYKQ